MKESRANEDPLAVAVSGPFLSHTLKDGIVSGLSAGVFSAYMTLYVYRSTGLKSYLRFLPALAFIGIGIFLHVKNIALGDLLLKGLYGFVAGVYLSIAARVVLPAKEPQK